MGLLIVALEVHRAWIGGDAPYFRWLLAAMMESGRQTWGCQFLPSSTGLGHAIALR